MGINDGFEKPVEMSEVCNETDLDLWELSNLDWKEVGTEQSNYSIMTATTYLNEDESIAKKIFSDGYIEYYYTV